MIKWIDYTGISVSAVVYKPGQWILLGYRTDQCRDEHRRRDNRWWWLKFNETIKDGIKRELKEEFDSEFADDQLIYLGHREQFRTHEGQTTHWIGFYHLAIIQEDQQITNMEPHKHSELKYFPLSALPHPEESHSMLYGILSDFKEQIETITGEKIVL